MKQAYRRLEINGGRVSNDPGLRLCLEPARPGYADAQIDDYGGLKRRLYRWRPGAVLDIEARFSHPDGQLVGTAGFGFWNAPFGDPSVRWPALPQATWFFYASRPSDLPFPESGPGRGWFAGTMDASAAKAVLLAPLAPAVVILNNISAMRQRIWPAIRHRLGISFAPIHHSMTEWHHYRLEWQEDGCRFEVDGNAILETGHTPRGPLGFVCWLDNQALRATPNGRFHWTTLPVPNPQWMEIGDLQLANGGRF